VKQLLVAVPMLFYWLIVGQVAPSNCARPRCRRARSGGG
jgi:hypothetical protein